jgi:hypothetical protein
MGIVLAEIFNGFCLICVSFLKLWGFEGFCDGFFGNAELFRFAAEFGSLFQYFGVLLAGITFIIAQPSRFFT